MNALLHLAAHHLFSLWMNACVLRNQENIALNFFYQNLCHIQDVFITVYNLILSLDDLIILLKKLLTYFVGFLLGGFHPKMKISKG